MKRITSAVAVKWTGLPIVWLLFGFAPPAQSADGLLEQCSDLMRTTKSYESWNPDGGWELRRTWGDIVPDESVAIIRTATFKSDWPYESGSLGPHPWPQLSVECKIKTGRPIVEFTFWQPVVVGAPSKIQVVLAWDGDSPILETAWNGSATRAWPSKVGSGMAPDKELTTTFVRKAFASSKLSICLPDNKGKPMVESFDLARLKEHGAEVQRCLK